MPLHRLPGRHSGSQALGSRLLPVRTLKPPAPPAGDGLMRSSGSPADGGLARGQQQVHPQQAWYSQQLDASSGGGMGAALEGYPSEHEAGVHSLALGQGVLPLYGGQQEGQLLAPGDFGGQSGPQLDGGRLTQRAGWHPRPPSTPDTAPAMRPAPAGSTSSSSAASLHRALQQQALQSPPCLSPAVTLSPAAEAAHAAAAAACSGGPVRPPLRPAKHPMVSQIRSASPASQGEFATHGGCACWVCCVLQMAVT